MTEPMNERRSAAVVALERGRAKRIAKLREVEGKAPISEDDDMGEAADLEADLAEAREADEGPAEPPGGDGDRRPNVLYAPKNLSVAVARAVRILANAENVYQRAGALVRVAEAAELGAVLKRHMAEACAIDVSPRIIPFTAATLRARMTESLVVVVKRTNPETGEPMCAPHPKGVPDAMTKAILDAGAWRGVRSLEAVSETPFLRPDGSVVTRRGYDEATAVYLIPSCPGVKVPDAPTREDAERALAELEEPFVDFPHRSRAAKMVPIAAVLTMLARHAIRGSVPAFLFDASTRGSGKSLQTDVVSLIATGRASPKMAWPPDEIELEKILAAFALEGATLVNFDNVASAFGGAPLERCLTAVDRVKLRVLGRTETPEVPWRALILGSGNNIVVSGDTSRRVIVSRVESPLENPEDRTGFRHPDLLAWVRENRPRLVRAALTLLRAFVVAGRPSQGLRAWGSFEAWAALVPQAIVWAGGADVMACRPEVEGVADPEKAALLAVIEHWPKLATDGELTAKRALDLLYPPERFRGPMPPDGFDDLREALEAGTNAKQGSAPSVKAVGWFLRRMNGRVVGAAKLVGHQNRKSILTWRVVAAGGAS